jgi:hypothetical protein
VDRRLQGRRVRRPHLTLPCRPPAPFRRGPCRVRAAGWTEGNSAETAKGRAMMPGLTVKALVKDLEPWEWS